MTVEGIELGRYLFYDGRLSGRTDPDSLMSCATCHVQQHSFECGLDHPGFTNGHPHGLSGVLTPHYMLPLINLVWNNEGYLWNGMVNKNNNNLGSATYSVPAQEPYNMKNIESVVWMAITAKHEINGNINKTVQLISSISMYPPMFLKAFGDEKITYDRISKAIAQFIRSLVSSNSRLDKYLRGEINLTDAERRGLVLFTTENGGDCFHCHGTSATPLMTTNLFYNNGLDNIFSDTRDRFSVTNNPNDKGCYRAPTLRNIGYTAPYMHDGRFKTLDEVLNQYNTHQVWSATISPLMHHIKDGGTRLVPSQLADLKAFLNALNDSSFITNPAFSNPRPQDPYFIK